MIISLQSLFTNRNRERILLFLLVNEVAYPSQIHSLLDTPLTPIQREMHLLETHGILISSPVGKTKIYRFNPSYPLQAELEALLRKAYILLPSCDKKKYCFTHLPRKKLSEEIALKKEQKETLIDCWNRLVQIRSLAFSIQSPLQELQRKGRAEVIVKKPSENVLVFQEKGSWMEGEMPIGSFSNSFRFTLDLPSLLITLEHLRYGENNPVFLFHLTFAGKHSLASASEHLCDQDSYLGHLTFASKGILFQWRVIGPQKNHFFSYHYT